MCPSLSIDDYKEACSIVELSPKAAATLARRCLQGMIRDFWKISKRRLIEEVEALQEHVDPLTRQAIDAIRTVGKIGAHMEKDINAIIDVDPGEAEKLISLIEILIADWYITRHSREDWLKKIVAIGQAKTFCEVTAHSSIPSESTHTLFAGQDKLGPVNTNDPVYAILRTWKSPTPSIATSRRVCRRHAAT